MDEKRYKFSAREAGSECQFEAEAESREELAGKIREHGSSCEKCSSLKEEDVANAIKEG